MVTDEEVAAAIKRECSHGDTEAAHGTADWILCNLLRTLGYEKTVAAWEEVDKWYA